MSLRSAESIRAEIVHREMKSSPRPLAKARSEFARRFDNIMHDHWVRGEEAYSNVALARVCGVDEKAVRQWRSGDKRLPPEAIAKFPSQLFDQTIDILAAMHGRAPKRAVAQLRQALVDLPTQMGREDLSEVIRALVNAQVQIAELMKKAVDGK